MHHQSCAPRFVPPCAAPPSSASRTNLLFRQPERSRTSMRKITLAGIDLDVWEGGDGPPVLFLHGAGGFRAEDPFVDLLSRGRRVIAPSHPGFGGSALPDWLDRPDDIAVLYLELLAQLGHAQMRPDRVFARRLDRGGTGQHGAGTVSPAGAGRAGRREARRPRYAGHSRHLRHARRDGRKTAVPRSGSSPARPGASCRTNNSRSCCAIARRPRC